MASAFENNVFPSAGPPMGNIFLHPFKTWKWHQHFYFQVYSQVDQGERILITGLQNVVLGSAHVHKPKFVFLLKPTKKACFFSSS